MEAESLTTDQTQPAGKGRRRVPRRAFETQVGVLFSGEYTLERSFQVGEGGMMVTSIRPLEVGSRIVVNFFLTNQIIIIVRGIVRAVVPPKDHLPQRYSLEFLNLEFQFKREIRNFVAAATAEGASAG